MPSNEDSNWYIAPRTRSVRGQLYQLLSKFEGINWFILFLSRFSNTNPSTLKTLSQNFSTFLHNYLFKSNNRYIARGTSKKTDSKIK